MPTVLRTTAAMRGFLDQVRAAFEIKPVPLSACTGWRLADGAIGHASGGFFSVIGLSFAHEPGRDAVLLHQPQSAITGLVVREVDGEAHFLFQARVEPGTYGVAQFAPTVQSTPANYLRLHGGKATAYLDYFFGYRPDAEIVHDSYQLDLGGRYLQKNKRVTFVRATAEVPEAENFAWIPASLVRAAAGETAMLNIDLRSMLAIGDWQGALLPDGDSALARAFRAGLAAPPRADVVGRVLTRLAVPPARWRLADVAQLRGWRLTDRALEERTPVQGFRIEFFEVTAPGREVVQWCQPLLNSDSSGAMTLLCRIADGCLEVFVRVRNEPGLSTGNALAPSELIYPGEPAGRRLLDPDGYAEAQVISRSTECDEGGRFYIDTTECAVLLAHGDEVLPDDGAWVTLSELKLLLRASNVCTIQLRSAASMLLAAA